MDVGPSPSTQWIWYARVGNPASAAIRVKRSTSAGTNPWGSTCSVLTQIPTSPARKGARLVIGAS